MPHVSGNLAHHRRCRADRFLERLEGAVWRHMFADTMRFSLLEIDQERSGMNAIGNGLSSFRSAGNTDHAPNQCQNRGRMRRTGGSTVRCSQDIPGSFLLWVHDLDSSPLARTPQMNPLRLPKIAKMPADARAFAELRNQIIAGTISPGTRLTEIHISEKMGLSRATIRTALHKLEKEGLVELVPYTGWTVVRLTKQDIWELYTLRAAIERLAAQLAASNPDRSVIRGVQRTFVALQSKCQLGISNAIAEADFSFHQSIVDAAGHSRLKQQYALIEQQIRVFIRSSDALIADPDEIVDQHKPIFDAIIDRNARLAGDLSEKHNVEEGEKLSRAVQLVDTLS